MRKHTEFVRVLFCKKTAPLVLWYIEEHMTQSNETRMRSILKSLSYRILSIVVDTAVAYFFTRTLSLSLVIVLVVNAYSTFLYYGHERIWGRIRFGRKGESL